MVFNRFCNQTTDILAILVIIMENIELLAGWKHPQSQYYRSWNLASELAGLSTGRQECSVGLREGEASFLVHYGVDKSLIENGKETKEDYLILLSEINKMLIREGFASEFEPPKGNYLIKEVIEKLRTAQVIGSKFVPGDLEQIQELLAGLTNK